MRVDVFVGSFDGPGGAAATGRALTRLARDSEAAGLAGIWVNDHLSQIPMFGAETDPVLEAYTTLGFLAAVTDTVELGTLTTGATYRHPGMLLKVVSTLDALSGGRSWLGIGPPWNTDEQHAFGIPVQSWPERFARLTEILRLTRQVWDGDEGPFTGEHYTLDRPVLHPPPLRRPPILVGGAHERRVLRLVAEYGDACNLFEDGGPGLLRLKLDLLRRECDKVGRPFDEIIRTSFGRITAQDGVEETVARLARLAELGIDIAILGPADPFDSRVYGLLSEVVARVAPFGRTVNTPFLVAERNQLAH